MRRIKWSIAAAAVCAGAWACGGEAPVAPKAAVQTEPSIAGRYSLFTVNARGLPQIIGYDGLGAVDVLSGLIELTGDAHYMDILTLRRRGQSGIEIHVDTAKGTFLRADRTLLLIPADGADPSFFDVNEGKLTALTGYYTIVYQRRD